MMILLYLFMFAISSANHQDDLPVGSDWIVLFDGTSLEQWRGVESDEIPEVWEVEEGWLKVRPNWMWGGDLVTREEFIDFELEFEWQLSPGANSGVKYLVDLERRNPDREEFMVIASALSLFLLIVLILLVGADQRSNRRFRVSTLVVFLLLASCLYIAYSLWQPGSSAVGLEMQLVDGGVSLSKTETSGALYDLMAPNAVVSLPPGQVNSSRIRVTGSLVEHWINGRKVLEYGEADAYGHRKKLDIGKSLAEEIKRITGEETMASDLTYDLRSGDPDSIDHLVAITFANIALDLISEGTTGRMVGIKNGRYSHSEIPDPSAGARTVDLEKFYNVDRYRPRYDKKLGLPVMLEAI